MNLCNLEARRYFKVCQQVVEVLAAVFALCELSVILSCALTYLKSIKLSLWTYRSLFCKLWLLKHLVEVTSSCSHLGQALVFRLSTFCHNLPVCLCILKCAHSLWFWEKVRSVNFLLLFISGLSICPETVLIGSLYLMGEGSVVIVHQLLCFLTNFFCH